MTLGSLFDGIGGFPLAAALNGIKTLWASEIETAPISITKRHFPDMKHLGDITKINGRDIDPVDLITFGSPCQNLSIAGKRAGLEGERSGLFMEAMRIIKEMREKTDGRCPARIIWENVDGAFSSNEGEDFRVVLEEIANIAGGAISIPRPPAKDGNAVWNSAGAVVGDGWSLAWRVLDAEYWGVPQRRCRIFLIGDFRGECAGEILFKPEGLYGDSAESGEAGEGIARGIENGFGGTGRGYWQKGIQCLRAEGENRPSRPSNVIVEKVAGFNGWRSVSGSLEYKDDCAPCLQATMPPDVVTGVDGHNQNLTGDKVNTLRGGRIDKDIIGLVILNDQGGSSINVEKGDISPTLKGQAKGYEPLVFEPGAVSRTGNHFYEDGTTGTLRANMESNQFAVALEHHPHDSRIKINEDGKVQTLPTRMGTGGGNVPLLMTKEDIAYKDRHAVATFNFQSLGEYKEGDISETRKARNDPTTETLITTFSQQSFDEYKESEVASTIKNRDYKDSTDLITVNYLVRRLTPLECERLMGFPDGWTEYGHDNKKISDSARYKVLGNSVAIPCVYFLMQRIKEIA